MSASIAPRSGDRRATEFFCFLHSKTERGRSLLRRDSCPSFVAPCSVQSTRGRTKKLRNVRPCETCRILTLGHKKTVRRRSFYWLSLWSNACFEAALAIGILSHGVLIADISTNALSSHSFIGLPKTFSTCRSGVGLCRLRRLCWYCSA